MWTQGSEPASHPSETSPMCTEHLCTKGVSLSCWRIFTAPFLFLACCNLQCLSHGIGCMASVRADWGYMLLLWRSWTDLQVGVHFGAHRAQDCHMGEPRGGYCFWYMSSDVRADLIEASVMSRDTSLAYSMLLSALETLSVIDVRSLVPTLYLLCCLCHIGCVYARKVWYFRIKTKWVHLNLFFYLCLVVFIT